MQIGGHLLCAEAINPQRVGEITPFGRRFSALWWIMGDFRYAAIAAMLRTMSAMGVDRLLAPAFRGRGLILTMHHVWRGRDLPFQPNRILEIAPEFLESVIRLIRAEGYDIAPLDEVPARLRSAGPPFVVLAFDDGYRDNMTEALPVLRRASAPFTVYVTTGFADCTTPLWWRDLEDVVRGADRLDVPFPDGVQSFATATGNEKRAAFETIYWRLRRGPEEILNGVIGDMARRAGVDRLGRVERLCLRWEELAAMAADPLCTIGAHTLTHPMLAKHPEEKVRAEIFGSRRIIAEKLGCDVRHLSYPVGDPASAGQREFAIARAAGFETAVTTRPGVLHAAHADHLLALPRISLNGLFQRPNEVRALLSGLPTAMQNRFRQLNVA